MPFIYILKDPRTTQPRYVGYSKHPERRLKEHLYCQGKSHRANWIRELRSLKLKPILEVIKEIPVIEWDYWEQYYIDYYKSLGFSLTNHAPGGTGVVSHSYKTKKQIARSLKGHKQTKEQIDQRIATRREIQKETGLWAPVGTYEQIAKTRIKNGKKWSRKMSKHQSKVLKEAYKNGTKIISGNAAKPYEQRKSTSARIVCEYNLDGVFKREWESVTQATHHYKPNGVAGSIICACKGEYNKTYNSIWRYKEPKINELPNTSESVLVTVNSLKTSKAFYSQNLKNQQRKINYKIRKKRGSINC